MWKLASNALRAIGFGRPELHKGLLEEKYFDPRRVSNIFRNFALHDHLFDVIGKQAFHHGVQGEPCCIAYDPIQKILAIGAKDGTIKLYVISPRFVF